MSNMASITLYIIYFSISQHNNENYIAGEKGHLQGFKTADSIS